MNISSLGSNDMPFQVFIYKPFYIFEKLFAVLGRADLIIAFFFSDKFLNLISDLPNIL